MFKPTTPENAERVEKTVKFLRSIPIEGRFDYGLLRKETGLDVARQRYLLERAFKILVTEDGIVFANVFGSGYERLPDSRVHETSIRDRMFIRNKAKRRAKAIKSVVAKSNGLDINSNRRLGAEVAILGLIGRAAEDRTVEMVSKTPGFDYKDEPHSMRAFADYLSRS